MTQYTTWSRADYKNVIRRELMDTNTKWASDAELNQYLDNWLNDLQAEFEFVWAINTVTVTGTTTGSLVIHTNTFSPTMLRCDAVYYNSYRLSGRSLQNLEVGNPMWRGQAGVVSTNTQDTPRLAVMYPDSQGVLIWPTPPPPTGTSSNIFTFEYPVELAFASDAATSGLPAWTQWSAKSCVCAQVYLRPGPINDLRRAQRYTALYARAKQRVRDMWEQFLPERYRVLKPGGHYEGNILIPPPAWDCGTNTATGT